MKIRKAYQCDFCDKARLTKRIIKDHEPICFKNPESKSCITCKHLTNNVGVEHHNDEYQDICKVGKDLKHRLQTRCYLYTQENDL